MKKSHDELTTSRLEGILKLVKDDEAVKQYVSSYTKGTYSSFAEYLNDYVIREKLSFADIMDRSNVSRNYFYNIVNGDRNPGRDKIIALCVAAGMSYEEVNKALKIAKEGVLYPKDERDAYITVAINNGIKNVTEINLILDDAGLEALK